MTKEKLAAYNIGENLDTLMNLDPRGYGVCRILYKASRSRAGKPVSLAMAEHLVESVRKNSLIYIMTGFILRPHKHPETDGITGAILLVRSQILAFDAKPVILCPLENIPAIAACSPLIGMHCFIAGRDGDELSVIKTAQELPFSFAVIPVSKDEAEAAALSSLLTAGTDPAAVFATEAPGANTAGEYHNAVGVNMTGLEAKLDVVFSAFQKKGVPSFAVGDLGNEIGMGAIAEHLRTYIPYTRKTARAAGCCCGCADGIIAASAADYLLTATVSDWGVYAIISALAYLKKDITIMHDERIERDVLTECSRQGMVDMSGALIPAIDGFSVDMICTIVSLMRSTVEYAIGYDNEKWFSETLARGFYDRL
jgi:hypothetical protein